MHTILKKKIDIVFLPPTLVFFREGPGGAQQAVGVDRDERLRSCSRRRLLPLRRDAELE